MKEHINNVVDIINKILEDNIYFIEEDESYFIVTPFRDIGDKIGKKILGLVFNIIPFLMTIIKLGGYESNSDFSESEYLTKYIIDKKDYNIRAIRSPVFYFDIVLISMGFLGVVLMFIKLYKELTEVWLGFFLMVGFIALLLFGSIIRLRHIYLVNRIMLKVL